MDGRDRNSQRASQKRGVLFCEINCIHAKRFISADVEKGLAHTVGERGVRGMERVASAYIHHCV